MKPSTLILTAIAATRLTRFVTTDSLGQWTITDPATRWAVKHEGGEVENGIGEVIPVHPRDVHHVKDEPLILDPSNGWRSKLVSGLYCPHCVGFWIGAGLLAGGTVAGKARVGAKLFTGLTGSLALSYLVGHVSQRLDN